MKRFLSLFVLIALLATLLVSCNLLEHEHTFAEEWTSDSDYHWHACTASEECTEKSDSAAHDYETTTDAAGALINLCKVCGYSNKKVSTAPAHDHVFAEEYAHSENFHWYACTVSGCYETDKKDAHQYGNPETTYENQALIITYVCVDCGYEKVERRTVDASVDSAVEWDAIFESFKLTNFSMLVYIGGQEDPSAINHCIVTESGVFYSLEHGREFYLLKNADGSYEGYERTGEDSYRIMDPENHEAYFNGATRETVIQLSFAENFEKFEYDAEKGIFFAEEAIEATYYNFSGNEMGTLICYNSEVMVADGKIISISCDYTFPESADATYSYFIYYNIGLSEVTIPQSVIDSAKANAES